MVRDRVPAAVEMADPPLATAIPQLADLSSQQLGVLAGHLHRTRIRRARAEHARSASYGMVAARNLTTITPAREPVILSRGAT